MPVLMILYAKCVVPDDGNVVVGVWGVRSFWYDI